jgi:Pseudouridylate synthases, 23S RNA-specific
MTGVDLVNVGADEDGLRLDRWFRRRYPAVTHGLLEKWLRLGYVRIDGRRAKSGERLSPGQVVRVPPMDGAGEAAAPPRQASAPVSEAEARALRSSVLHMDDDVIAVDKPVGLAVQGGSKVQRHLDAMLDALSFGGERPRLVHRLDKDTSGVLVLARTAAAAAKLTAAFRGRVVRKLYWAIVVDVPSPSTGRITLPLIKRRTADGERMVVDEAAGDTALTTYRLVDHIGRRAAWLALEPLTGRTHQLRVHCAALGTPILGDGKYGGDAARIAGAELDGRLHLLARCIRFPHPRGGDVVVRAPLPAFMDATWRYLGFAPNNPIADLE